MDTLSSNVVASIKIANANVLFPAQICAILCDTRSKFLPVVARTQILLHRCGQGPGARISAPRITRFI